MRRKTGIALVVTLLIAALSVLGTPAPAQALTAEELQAQLTTATAKLSELNHQSEAAGEQLLGTQEALEQTKTQIANLTAQIAAEQTELTTAQATLSSRVASNYKSGPTTFLSSLLGSTSFDDFVTRLYYADKISEADAQAIQDVKDLKASLETQQVALVDQQRQQEDLLVSQQEQQATYQAQVAEQQAYVNGLDTEVQAALAEQQAAANAAAQAAAQSEAAAAAAAANATAATTDTGTTAATTDTGTTNTNTTTGNTGTTTGGNTGATTGGSTGTTTGGGTTSGTLSASARAAIVAAAYSQVGVTWYVWGGTTPFVGLDCSGLSQYCYSCAGYSINRTAAAQYDQCAAAGHLVSADQLQAGDLVFYNYAGYVSHVSVYVGGGMVVEETEAGTLCSCNALGGPIVGYGTPV